MNEEEYKKRKKGGAPKKDVENRKVLSMNARVTKEEKRIMKESLKKYGYKTLSVFLNDTLVLNKIRMKIQYDLPDDIQKELRMIGNNYNQIAKILHINLQNHDLKDLREFMQNVRNSFNEIIVLMKSIDPNYKNKSLENDTKD